MSIPVSPAPVRALREDIMRAALQLFAEQGYSETSIRQVAEASGCTKPALYYYFSSKEELFRQIIDREVEGITALMWDAAKSSATVREKLVAITLAMLEHVTDNPAAMRLMQRVDMRAEAGAPAVDVHGSREQHLRMVEDMLREGQARGEVRADLDPRDCTVTLFGALELHFEFWLQSGGQATGGPLTAIELLFEGIATR